MKTQSKAQQCFASFTLINRRDVKLNHFGAKLLLGLDSGIGISEFRAGVFFFFKWERPLKSEFRLWNSENPHFARISLTKMTASLWSTSSLRHALHSVPSVLESDVIIVQHNNQWNSLPAMFKNWILSISTTCCCIPNNWDVNLWVFHNSVPNWFLTQTILNANYSPFKNWYSALVCSIQVSYTLLQ